MAAKPMRISSRTIAGAGVPEERILHDLLRIADAAEQTIDEREGIASPFVQGTAVVSRPGTSRLASGRDTLVRESSVPVIRGSLGDAQVGQATVGRWGYAEIGCH